MSLGSGLLPSLNQRLPRAPQAGELAVVASRAGVGKSGFLVQLALDALDAGQRIVHLTLAEGLDDLRRRYIGIGAADALRNPNLLLQSYPDVRQLDVETLRKAKEQIWQPLGLAEPNLILLDGLGWSAEDQAELAALKQLAASCSAVLWTTALTHRHENSPERKRLPRPLDERGEASDLILSLEPEGNRIRLHLLMAYGHMHTPDPRSPVADDPIDILLERTWLKPISSETQDHLSPADCLLLSGGAEGAEAAFGEEAARAGVSERNFSFDGHDPVRSNGLVMLSDDELALGKVSWSYLKTHMGRDYKNDPKLQRVLQSIWHQVNPAGEVFAVGQLQADGTAKGGTGWAVELARHLKKPVWVFDQEDQSWSSWFVAQQRWQPCDDPIITCKHFAGSGTRHLNEAGRQAIRGLFERSFPTD